MPGPGVVSRNESSVVDRPRTLRGPPRRRPVPSLSLVLLSSVPRLGDEGGGGLGHNRAPQVDAGEGLTREGEAVPEEVGLGSRPPPPPTTRRSVVVLPLALALALECGAERGDSPLLRGHEEGRDDGEDDEEGSHGAGHGVACWVRSEGAGRRVVSSACLSLPSHSRSRSRSRFILLALLATQDIVRFCTGVGLRVENTPRFKNANPTSTSI